MLISNAADDIWICFLYFSEKIRLDISFELVDNSSRQFRCNAKSYFLLEIFFFLKIILSATILLAH